MLTRLPAASIRPTPTDVTPRPPILNEDRHQPLPEGCEMIRRVDGDEPRHTDSARGCEERVDKGHVGSLLHGHRKAQEHRPEKDHSREAEGDQSARRLPLKKPYSSYSVFHSSLSRLLQMMSDRHKGKSSLLAVFPYRVKRSRRYRAG